jgi:hypothetical protein
MWWFKRKYRQIQRVIDFLPIIWKGYDWDYSYAIQLFKKQLERTATSLESEKAVTQNAKINAQKIRTAIRLMDKVYDGDYSFEYMETIDKLYGKTHYHFVELDEKPKYGDEPMYQMVIKNENVVDEKHQKEIDEVRKEMMRLSHQKEMRAHKLLWDFIEHNIKSWWD